MPRPFRAFRCGGLSICALLLSFATVADAASLAHLWSHTFGSTGNELVVATAVDAVGSVYVTGTFQGTIDLGGGNLVSAGDDDVFLAKYDATGNHLWSQRHGGVGNDQVYAMALGATGQIVLTGSFTGTTTIAGVLMSSSGAEDVFVATFYGNGSAGPAFSGGGPGSDVGRAVVRTAQNDVIVAGTFEDAIFMGGSVFLSSAGQQDVFLVGYPGAALPVWGAAYGGTGNDTPVDLALDGNGNLFLLGRFSDTASFGGASLVSAGDEDIVLASYTTLGGHQWSKRLGGVGNDTASALTVHPGSHDLFLCGNFDAPLDLGGGALATSGQYDIFLARFTDAGDHVWSGSFGGTQNETVASVAAAASGDVVVTGWFNGTIDMGGDDLVSAGFNDIFLARYDEGGAHVWSQRIGGASFDYGIGLATGPDGSVVLGGAFSSTVDFGGGNRISAGGPLDGFVARYGAGTAEPVIQTIVDVGNDQGRRVTISFRASGYDSPAAATPVQWYEAYLRIDPVPRAALARTAESPDRLAMLAAGWEFVGSVPAYGAGDYLMGALTDADSTIARGQHQSAYFVRAATRDPVVFFDSAIDSGYSLDDLAPPAPGSLTYSASVLSWLPSTAEDFDYFSVYGSTSEVLDGDAVVIEYTTGTAIDVSASPYGHYYVTATDHAGNEGPASAFHSPTGTTGPLPRRLEIHAHPNPFNPRTTLRYDVPVAGRATITVHDAAGARVATLLDAAVTVGSHDLTWDGSDDHGRQLGSGIYFVRVDSNGESRTRKIALVK